MRVEGVLLPPFLLRSFPPERKSTFVLTDKGVFIFLKIFFKRVLTRYSFGDILRVVRGTDRKEGGRNQMTIKEAIKKAAKLSHITQWDIARIAGYKTQAGVAQRLSASEKMLSSTLLNLVHACGYRVWIVPKEVWVPEGLELTNDRKSDYDEGEEE